MHKDVLTCFLFYFILADHLGHSHILLATFEKVRAKIIFPEIWIIYSWFITIHYYDVLSILNSKNRLIFYRCINNTYNCCLLCQHMDGSYCVKPLKQKQVVNTSAFLLSLHLTSFCVATLFFWKTKTHQSFISSLKLTSGPWEQPPLFIAVFLFPGGWRELPTAGDLWDREQIQQPGIKGKNSKTYEAFQSTLEVTWKSTKSVSLSAFANRLLPSVLMIFVSRLPTTKSATTARSALCVCLMCETRSSCHADTCVSAMPVQTPCATRPTAALSADCVSSDIETLIFWQICFTVKWKQCRTSSYFSWTRCILHTEGDTYPIVPHSVSFSFI